MQSEFSFLLEIKSGAEFSDCRKHRYHLYRIWDTEKKIVMFIGLNPSKANESDDDATIRRIKNFCESWGFGGFYIVNCFSFISTKPKGLKEFLFDKNFEKEHEKNISHIQKISLISSEIIFCWGNSRFVKEINIDKDLFQLFPNSKALVINKNGSPRHPLYVPRATTLKNYNIR